MITEDQELRERCVNKIVEANGCESASDVVAKADILFHYIKNGGDTENDVEDEPTPPVNTDPGIARLRDMLLRNRDIPNYCNQ